MEVREIIERWINDNLPVQTFAGKVTAVNADANTCTVEPINGGAVREEVRLCAAITSITNPVVVIPKVNSTVICGIIENNKRAMFVMLCAEVAEVKLRGDAFGGIVKVGDLVDKLNAIEQDLNTLKTVFSTWVVVPMDGGAALKAAAATWYGDQLTPTVADDISNDNVKHG